VGVNWGARQYNDMETVRLSTGCNAVCMVVLLLVSVHSVCLDK
jgi:hypothetical protein